MHALHFPRDLFVGLCLTLITAALPAADSICTSEQRIAGAKQIPDAYNLKPLGASAAAFEEVPFAPDCVIKVYPNGLPGVTTAVDAATSRAFAVATRQAFSDVTGEYTDFANGTTVIHTVVTLGARDLIPLPVKFSADVYLTYDLGTCQIEMVDAYATIPTELLGFVLDPPRVSRKRS